MSSRSRNNKTNNANDDNMDTNDANMDTNNNNVVDKTDALSPGGPNIWNPMRLQDLLRGLFISVKHNKDLDNRVFNCAKNSIFLDMKCIQDKEDYEKVCICVKVSPPLLYYLALTYVFPPMSPHRQPRRCGSY
jgi:hypothetical protein